METSEASEFERFLVNNRNEQFKKKSALPFLMGNQVKSLFAPISDQSEALGIALGLEQSCNPVPPIIEALEQAKARFEFLPLGYCSFMKVLGPGIWANARIRHPHYLRSQWYRGLESFVPLADNVDGMGGCVLFNPDDQSESNKMYFACNDPAGYGLLSDSFEGWIYSLTELWKKNPDHCAEIYDNIDLIEFREK